MAPPERITIQGVRPLYDPVSSPLDLPAAPNRFVHIRNRSAVAVDVQMEAPPADADGYRYRNRNEQVPSGSAAFFLLPGKFAQPGASPVVRLNFAAAGGGAVTDVDYAVLDVS